MRGSRKWMWCLAILVLLPCQRDAEAIGLTGLGLKVGVDLTQEKDVVVVDGAAFDTASLILGGHLDLGEVFMAKVHLVPGFDVVLHDRRRIYSMNGDFRYFLARSERTAGYAGVGIGVHLIRSEIQGQDDTKGSLNIPLGFQQKLSGGLLWFGELKVVIGEQTNDSSFRFSVGVALGKSN